MAARQTAYDEIPYQSNPSRQTRPERLAAVAKLFGLDAPPVAGCRVLELGCSTGGNLIAMAQDFPGARFVGVDASARQIADGWKTIDTLGLKNIPLRHLDILDIGDGMALQCQPVLAELLGILRRAEFAPGVVELAALPFGERRSGIGQIRIRAHVLRGMVIRPASARPRLRAATAAAAWALRR
jgi:SAM-dependent methyltransferase